MEKGTILKHVELEEDVEDVFVRFTDTNNKEYILSHHRDCCESTILDEVIGNLQDLIDSVVISMDYEYEDLTDDKHTYESEDKESFFIETGKGKVGFVITSSSDGCCSTGTNGICEV